MPGGKFFGWLFNGIHRAWEALLALIVQILPLALIAYVGLIIITLSQSSHWPFSLQAQSRIVEISLHARSETRWDVSSAVLCLRTPLAKIPASYTEVDGETRVRRFCGSANRHAYAPSSGRYAPELAAVLGGRPAKGSTEQLVRISSIGLGRIVMHIDDPSSSSGKPMIRIEGSGATVLRIPAPASFNWSTSDTREPLVFPFSGAIRVGQDVNASRRELLENGRISIYSPSQQNAGGRALVESIDLLPGDMVDLSAGPSAAAEKPATDAANDEPAFARGFIRITAEEMARPRPTMQVVAFGQSNHVRVRRFGEAGLDFQPSIWSRLTHDNWVVATTLLLISLLSILASVSESRNLANRRQR